MRTSDSNKIMWVAAIGAAIGLIAASFYLPGGDDLYRYYLPFAQGCLHCGFMPYFAQWFLAPLRWLPEYPFSWGVWSLFSVSGILILAYYTKANPFLLLISFPALGQVWLGQVDIFIATGLVVFLFNKNPYLRGLGLIVALSKPQLTALPIFFCLLMEEDPRLFLKLFLIPSIIILLSFIFFGVNWIPQWILETRSNLPIHVWRLASLDVWKFGIFLTPIPILFREKRDRMLSSLLISALATPFYGVYSYLVFLLFEVNWWHVVLSFVWMIGFLFLHDSAMRLAWILPLAMLVEMLYKKFKPKGIEDVSQKNRPS